MLRVSSSVCPCQSWLSNTLSCVSPVINLISYLTWACRNFWGIRERYHLSISGLMTNSLRMTVFVVWIPFTFESPGENKKKRVTSKLWSTEHTVAIVIECFAGHGERSREGNLKATKWHKRCCEISPGNPWGEHSCRSVPRCTASYPNERESARHIEFNRIKSRPFVSLPPNLCGDFREILFGDLRAWKRY
jgi:hypothetical protein